jgi:hypothetical protein
MSRVGDIPVQDSTRVRDVRVATALRDGSTTARASLGAGLGICRRLSHAFAPHGAPGRDAGSAARPERDDTCVAVLAPAPSDGSP